MVYLDKPTVNHKIFNTFFMLFSRLAKHNTNPSYRKEMHFKTKDHFKLLFKSPLNANMKIFLEANLIQDFVVEHLASLKLGCPVSDL